MGQTAGAARIEPGAPSLLLRFVYFVLIGWWLGLMVSAFAWVLNATVVGLPLGLFLINRLPTLITLRPQEQTVYLADHGWRVGQPQYPWLVRAVYFVLIGWWLSGIWLAGAYALLVTIVGAPLAFWMYGRIGAVTTLYRS